MEALENKPKFRQVKEGNRALGSGILVFEGDRKQCNSLYSFINLKVW